ncbi:MAG: cell division protein FtsZ [Chthonomonas sp.]|nr:cell division protein FtsZ [Chthonomonas sp.]
MFAASEPHAKIKVIGVGGAGGNAVNRMVSEGMKGVEFIALNTDAQVLAPNKAHKKLRLGETATRGLGAGGDPVIGEAAAKESEKAILELIDNADMVFVTAGMGGGTGTGAAPIVAEIAKRKGILTVGVVSKPFGFEGPKRRKVAEEGALRLAEHVDTLIIVPNDNLSEVVDRRSSVAEAFAVADDVLRQGVQGISDIVLKPGLINVDFADVRTVLSNAGRAVMGMAKASGEQRARLAAEAAANSPLLETSIQSAKRLLVNITSGSDFTLDESAEVMEYIQQFADADDADIFMGHVLDENVKGEVLVTLLAAGLSTTPRRVIDRQVFPEPDRTAHPNIIDEREFVTVAQAETAVRPAELELDLDVPTFLRRQRSGA